MSRKRPSTAKQRIVENGDVIDVEWYISDDDGRPPPLKRRASDSSNQRHTPLCYIHVLAKVLTRFVVILRNMPDDDKDHEKCSELFDPTNGEFLLSQIENMQKGESDGEELEDEDIQSNGEESDGENIQSDGENIQSDGEESNGENIQSDGEESDGEESEGEKCYPITIFKAILNRTFYNILTRATSTTKGGRASNVMHIFDYIAELSFGVFIDSWLPPELIELKTELNKKQEILEELLEKPFSSKEGLQQLQHDIELLEEKIKEWDTNTNTGELIQEYTPYLITVYESLKMIDTFWKTNQLAAVHLGAQDLNDPRIIVILKEILRMGYYAYASFFNGVRGHAMTIVGFNEENGKYLFKNSWGSNNNFNNILFDGEVDPDIIEKPPIPPIDVSTHNGYYLKYIFIFITKKNIEELNIDPFDPENPPIQPSRIAYQSSLHPSRITYQKKKSGGGQKLKKTKKNSKR
uniref:Uncharacterized protein n=1 Tax=viral metagenome TaxID=1070528 RepID=A0A6C0HU22_9ZZZZ